MSTRPSSFASPRRKGVVSRSVVKEYTGPAASPAGFHATTYQRYRVPGSRSAAGGNSETVRPAAARKPILERSFVLGELVATPLSLDPVPVRVLAPGRFSKVFA
ncbi:MAG: hypothetical protein ACUVYA_11715 [Planctomycetota bacterium]